MHAARVRSGAIHAYRRHFKSGRYRNAGLSYAAPISGKPFFVRLSLGTVRFPFQTLPAFETATSLSDGQRASQTRIGKTRYRGQAKKAPGSIESPSEHMLLPIRAIGAVSTETMAELMLAAASLSPGACCSHSGNIPPAKDKAAQGGNQPRIRWELAESRSASGKPLRVAVVRPQPAKQSASVRTRAHRVQPLERAPRTEAPALQNRIPPHGNAAPVSNGAMLQAFRDIRSGLLDARRHVRQAKMHEWIHHERAVLDVVRRLRDLAPAASYEYADEDRTIRTEAVTLLDRLQSTDGRPGQ